MRIAKLALALLGFALTASALADDGFKVVANGDVPYESLSKTQLSDLFLKRTTTWPGGTAVAPVDLGEGSATADAFCRAIMGKPASVIRAFWKRVAMSGRDTPPAVRASDEDVIAFVRSNRGAVGYVSSGASTSGVKIIKVGD